jgi:hypothetical protein
MLAHGFTTEQVVELVRAGLATATAERVRAGNRTIEVARVRITEVGRRALAEGESNKMNWRRGLFRLWIIGAVVFAIAVSCVSYSGIKAEFDAASRPNKVFEVKQPDGSVFEVRAPDMESAVAAVSDLRNPPPSGFIIDPTPATPWASIGRVASVALGIPVAVLILGAFPGVGFLGLLCQAALNMPSLILKRASASRPSGQWSDDDYDVIADRAVVGRIFKANASPVGASWMRTLIFGAHHRALENA